MLSPSKGQVAYALLTRSPLRIEPKLNSPFDLHVLGTPPAFVLSQDQTLQYTLLKNRLALNYLIQNFVCLAHLLSAFALSKLARTFAFSWFLFSFQGAAVFRRLVYNSTYLNLCQHFFEKFCLFFYIFQIFKSVVLRNIKHFQVNYYF